MEIKEYGKYWKTVLDKETRTVFVLYQDKLFNKYTFKKLCSSMEFFNSLKTITDLKFSNIIKNHYINQ